MKDMSYITLGFITCVIALVFWLSWKITEEYWLPLGLTFSGLVFFGISKAIDRIHQGEKP
jgi:hypothetical protein